MQKVYIFDLDGTLYDRKKLKQRIILSYLGKGFWRSLILMGSERSARKELRLQNTGTMGYSEFFALVAKKSGESPEYVRDWYNNSYMVHMAQVLEKHYCARPGIVDKIKALKKEGARVLVLSDYGNIENKLKALKIDPSLFEFLLDSPSLGGFKPSSCVFLTACQIVGCEPSEAIMIGDRPEVDGGSVNVGMPYVDITDF